VKKKKLRNDSHTENGSILTETHASIEQSKGRFIVDWDERVRYMVPEGLTTETDLKPYVDPSTPKVAF
jgi:hypothetical protein